MKTIKDIAVSNPTPWGDLAQAIDENFNELYLNAPNYCVGYWDKDSLNPESLDTLGDVSLLKKWDFYLLDTTDNADKTTLPVGKLKRNNLLRFEDGSFAPTVGITEDMRAECDVALYLDNSQTTLYCEAASFAVEIGVSEGVEFDFYGEKYWYKNVTGVNGLADGEMNVRVYKLMKETISAFTPTGEAADFDVEVILRMGLCGGMNLSGDVFAYWGGGYEQVGTCSVLNSESRMNLPVDLYLQPDQTKWLKEDTVSKNDLGKFDFEKSYISLGRTVNLGDGYASDRHSYTPFKKAKGGGINTGECFYAWDNNYWSNTLNQRCRIASRFRGYSSNSYCSPRILNANHFASFTYRLFAGSSQNGYFIFNNEEEPFSQYPGVINQYKTKHIILWMKYVAVLLNIMVWLYFPSFVQYLDMEQVKNISKGINISDIYAAAQRSFKGHNDKPEVVNFKKNFENNCLYLFEALSNGYWKYLLGYKPMEKTGRNGKKTGKNLAYEFHGNYQSLIKYLKACEQVFTKDGILPLKGVEIENQCGYIFKGSTNQITYIQEQ